MRSLFFALVLSLTSLLAVDFVHATAPVVVANAESLALASELMKANEQMAGVVDEAETIAEAANAMAKGGSKLTRGFSMKTFNGQLPALTKTITQLYATNFTVAEMKSVIAFYTSSKGRMMMDMSRMVAGKQPSTPGFGEAEAKAGMAAGVEFQASPVGQMYAERLNKIQAKAGVIIEAANDKARAAGMDR